jgi:uncharacterized membrane protein HdeD (DUF308 family)
MATRDQLFESNFWWVLSVRGLAAILFGLAAVFWPGLTLSTLVVLFSAFVLVNGVVGLVHGLTGLGREGLGWVLSLVLSFLEVAVGVYLLQHGDVTLGTFVQLVGLVLGVRGVFELVAAYTEDGAAPNRTLVLLGGVLSVLAAVVVLRQSEDAGLTFVWVLGVYALLAGPMLVAQSIESRAVLGKGRRA